MRKAAHMTMRAIAVAAVAPAAGAGAANAGSVGGGPGGPASRWCSSGAHSVNAFLRSMTMRAIALTTKVRTNSTRPAAM